MVTLQVAVSIVLLVGTKMVKVKNYASDVRKIHLQQEKVNHLKQIVLNQNGKFHPIVTK